MNNTKLLDLDKYLEYVTFCKVNSDWNDDRQVYHKHHIIPKSIGGGNERTNLVRLTVENHRKAHLLFAQCFDDGSYEQNVNIWAYQVLGKSLTSKEELSEISKSRTGENNPFFGKKMSESHKEKLKQLARKRKGMTYEEIYGEASSDQKEVRAEKQKEVWESRTDEEKKSISAKSSETRKANYSPTHNSKEVTIDGVTYPSIKRASEILGVSIYYIRKGLK